MDGKGPRKGRKPPKRHRLDPEVRAKAEAVVKRSGLPMHFAVQVARGHLSVNDALKKLMEREKVERLVAKHGMSVPLAQAVVRGSLSLEDALLSTEMHKCAEWVPERSVLMELARSGQPATFFEFGREPYRATVVKNLKFDVVLRPSPAAASGEAAPMDTSGGEAVEGADTESRSEPGEQRSVTKHFLKLVSIEASAAELAPFLTQDDAVAALGLGASTSYRDRFRSKKRILFKHHRDEIPTRIALRDGTQLVGLVGWFGKWEFSLDLLKPAKKIQKKKRGPSIVVFRHAMHVLEAA